MPKRILVTGASRGIGEAIMHKLLEEKDVVVVGTATREAGVEAINQRCQAANLPGAGYLLDITDQQQVESCLSEGFDAVVNNAGMTKDGLSMRMSIEDWQSVIDTNLTGAFRVSQAAIKLMMKARKGAIVNISSVVAAMGNPGQANYVSAKAGLIGMTKSMALEVASRGIRINCVAPGFIETDMTEKLSDAQKDAILSRVPLKRMAKPEEVASVVAFLLSDQASYITGETIHVNGGLYLG